MTDPRDRLRPLDEIEPPDLRAAARRARERGSDPAEPTGEPGAGRRLGIVALAFVVFMAAGLFAWRALRETAAPGQQPSPTETPGPAAATPDVAQVVCDGDSTTVLTPEVRPQADGVHVQADIRDGTDQLAFWRASDLPITEDKQGDWDSWVYELGRSTEIVVDFGPDDYVVQCRRGFPGFNAPDTNEMVPLTVLDPDGMFHPDELSCSGGHLDREGSAGFVSVNPDAAAAIPRAIPGILAGDIVGPAGYALGMHREYQWRVDRDGETVALIMEHVFTHPHEGGDYRYLDYVVCSDAGIGDRGAPTAGPLATPYEVPGTPRCDPYAQECSSVFVSVARYADLHGEDPRSYGYPDPPSMQCSRNGEPSPCTPDADEVALTLLMTPADAEALAQAEGCGATEESMCTRSGT